MFPNKKWKNRLNMSAQAVNSPVASPPIPAVSLSNALESLDSPRLVIDEENVEETDGAAAGADPPLENGVQALLVLETASDSFKFVLLQAVSNVPDWVSYATAMTADQRAEHVKLGSKDWKTAMDCRIFARVETRKLKYELFAVNSLN